MAGSPKRTVFYVLFFSSFLFQTYLSAPLLDDTKILQLIEQEAAKLDLESLSDDQLLIQNVDKEAGLTIYFPPIGKSSQSPLFHTKGVKDVGRKIIVLSSADDNLEPNTRKQTYIVLVQYEEPENYKVIYAYFRDAIAADKLENLVQLGTQKYRIEWDAWTPRGKRFNNKAHIFGWIVCTQSSLLPCKRVTQASPEDSLDHIEENLNLTSTILKTYGVSNHSCPDYFIDLNLKPSEAQLVGLIIGSLYNALGILAGAENTPLSMPLSNDIQKSKGRTLSLASNLTSSQNQINPKEANESISIPVSFFDMVTKIGMTAMAKIHRPKNDLNNNTGRNLGKQLLKDLTYGADEKGKSVNPIPATLLEEMIAQDLFTVLVSGTQKNNASQSAVKDTAALEILPPNSPRLKTDTDLFSHFGWQTRDVTQNDLPTTQILHEAAFIGFGNCKNRKWTSKELSDSKGYREIADFYMAAMRTECVESQREELRQLGKLKYFVANHDTTISIPPSSELYTTDKLSVQEIGYLSKAFELSAFSHIYVSKVSETTTNVTNPMGNKISKSVLFLQLMSMRYLEQILKYVPGHMIKLIRGLVNTLQTSLTKALQDLYRYKNCLKCQPNQTAIAYHDALTLLGIIQFLITNDNEYNKSSTPTQQTFDKWFKETEHFLVHKLQFYIV